MLIKKVIGNAKIAKIENKTSDSVFVPFTILNTNIDSVRKIDYNAKISIIIVILLLLIIISLKVK